MISVHIILRYSVQGEKNVANAVSYATANNVELKSDSFKVPMAPLANATTPSTRGVLPSESTILYIINILF